MHYLRLLDIRCAAITRRITTGLSLLLTLAVSATAAPFEAPIKLTDGETLPEGTKYQMSRNGQGTLQWGPDGRLHLVYWSGGNTTTAAAPSRVWWRALTKGAAWSAPVQLDQSLTPGGQQLGGRQPSMAFRGDGGLFVTWHDHRNATSTQGWINNVEIYGDLKPAGGNFSGTDLRLTNTNAGTAGDNGYLPRVAALSDGRLALTWHEYYWNANGPSDICLRLSDGAGNFGAPPPMDNVRATFPADRAAEDTNKDFTVASAVTDSSGTLHMVWQAGNPAQIAGTFDLYYGRYDIASATWLEKGQLRNAAGHYLDPAKLVAGADGAIYLVYSDYSTGTTRNLRVQRRAPGALGFAPPVTVASFTIPDSIEAASYVASPDLVVESDGRMHVVYAGRKSDGSDAIFYRQIGAAGNLLDEQELTAGRSGFWTRPALARDPSGDLYVVFEENSAFNSGDLWFTQALGMNAVGAWAMYD